MADTYFQHNYNCYHSHLKLMVLFERNMLIFETTFLKRSCLCNRTIKRFSCKGILDLQTEGHFERRNKTKHKIKDIPS